MAVFLHDEDLVFCAVAFAFAVLYRGGKGGGKAKCDIRCVREAHRNVAPDEARARAPWRLCREAVAHVPRGDRPGGVEVGACLGAFGERARRGGGHLGEDGGGKRREADGMVRVGRVAVPGDLEARVLAGRQEHRDGMEGFAGRKGERGVDGIERRQDAARPGDGREGECVGGVGWKRDFAQVRATRRGSGRVLPPALRATPLSEVGCFLDGHIPVIV